MTFVYRRTGSFDQEELENELVVMELDSQAVVTLNPTGRMVWEALEGGATLDELDAIFREAYPEVEPAALRRDIQGVLDTLSAAGLAVADADQS